MKVWYILMIFPSPSETFVANDVLALARLGIDVSVHALRGRRRDTERLIHERDLTGVRVTHATLFNVLRGLSCSLRRPILTARVTLWVLQHSGRRAVHLVKGLALIPRIMGLFAHLERDRPDVVHIYWGHYPSILGWLVLEQAPRTVVSMSLSAYDLLRGFPGSAAVGRRAHLISTWAAANVPAIALRGIPSETIHVSRQGVDLERVRYRRFTKIPHRVVAAGRLVKEKGMDDVLRAFAHVAAEYRDSTLVILGDGPDRQRLERLAASLGIGNATTFRGHIAHDEVFEELEVADLFLFLSRYAAERLPNVVKEAMACRCTVVTTDTLGIDELMRDGEHGRIVRKGDWEEAARCVIEAFANPESTQAMADAAQSVIFQRFDRLQLMRALVRKWEDLTVAVAPTPQPI
jgi:glycosyltransferase involved in cell wall biosynthesis